MLPKTDSFWYLASPYSGYPDGRSAAYRRICRIAAVLVAQNHPVYCPIAHSYPLAETGLVPSDSYEVWLGVDFRFIDASGGLVIAKMEGWASSHGISKEIEHAERTGKPVHYLEPETVSLDFRSY